MDVVHERCCGLEVHKRTVVACVIQPDAQGRPQKTMRTFGTMTADLEALATWLVAAGCTHVVMESTGVYWQPVWNVLEERFTLVLVNARHLKAVPGRKTDVRDAEWLADLLRHGLVRGSRVPDRAQRELRELTRYRTALVRERAAAINRLQKTLESANRKLAAVASNVMGVSGREILAAVLGGDTDPAVLAELAHGRLRAKLPQLQQALAGRIQPHHRFLLTQQLAHLDSLEASIEQLSAEVAERMRPFTKILDRLDSIPGVGRRIAEILVAEVGADVSAFPSAAHLASWAGMCPGNHESAGKRHSGRTRPGNPWLRTALVEAAQAAGRTKETYLAAQYRRLATRRGKKRAAIAVGHSILVIAYHLLKRETDYADLGANYFDERERQLVERRLVRRLQGLGYEVTLTPKVA